MEQTKLFFGVWCMHQDQRLVCHVCYCLLTFSSSSFFFFKDSVIEPWELIFSAGLAGQWAEHQGRCLYLPALGRRQVAPCEAFYRGSRDLNSGPCLHKHFPDNSLQHSFLECSFSILCSCYCTFKNSQFYVYVCKQWRNYPKLFFHCI